MIRHPLYYNWACEAPGNVLSRLGRREPRARPPRTRAPQSAELSHQAAAAQEPAPPTVVRPRTRARAR